MSGLNPQGLGNHGNFDSTTTEYASVAESARFDHPQREFNTWRLPVGANWSKDAETPFGQLIGTASWNQGGTADPWTIRPSFDRDNIYMFFEVFNSDESLRRLAVASAPISDPFDMQYRGYANPLSFTDTGDQTGWSFPQCFEHGGAVYLLASDFPNMRLFKTTPNGFPDSGWSEVWTLDNLDVGDLSLVHKHGRWFGIGTQLRTDDTGGTQNVQEVVIGTELEDKNTFRFHPQRYIPPHRNTNSRATKSGILHKFGEHVVMYYQLRPSINIGCAVFDEIGPNGWGLTRYDNPVLDNGPAGVWDNQKHHLSVERIDDTYYGYYDGKDPTVDNMWRVGGVTMEAVL